MGPDSDPYAVVDPTLRVYGVQGLRVIDASIMPRITSGNINAPVIMIGEKGADLIKEYWFGKENARQRSPQVKLPYGHLIRDPATTHQEQQGYKQHVLSQYTDFGNQLNGSFRSPPAATYTPNPYSGQSAGYTPKPLFTPQPPYAGQGGAGFSPQPLYNGPSAAAYTGQSAAGFTPNPLYSGQGAAGFSPQFAAYSPPLQHSGYSPQGFTPNLIGYAPQNIAPHPEHVLYDNAPANSWLQERVDRIDRAGAENSKRAVSNDDAVTVEDAEEFTVPEVEPQSEHVDTRYQQTTPAMRYSDIVGTSYQGTMMQMLRELEAKTAGS